LHHAIPIWKYVSYYKDILKALSQTTGKNDVFAMSLPFIRQLALQAANDHITNIKTIE
jgi:hypothetical protein